MYALVHPGVEVDAYVSDPDDAMLAAAIEPMPGNLHIIEEGKSFEEGGRRKEEGEMLPRNDEEGVRNVIDFNDILRGEK